MGYQESYMIKKFDVDFEEIVSNIKSLGEQYYNDIGAYPACILTFKKKHDIFKKGDKVIYFVGERYPQDHYYEANEGIASGFSDKCDIVFTEYVDPRGIWPDATPDNKFCVKIEDFKFN